MDSVKDNNAIAFERLGLAGTKEGPQSAKLGQEAFLELMMTQLKNQDPFKPMESGEFLSQIAQFSSVTGIQDLQSSFSTLSSSLTSNQALQASSLVGRTVLVPQQTALLGEGGSISGTVDLPSSTPELVLNIHDPSGQLVRRISLGQQADGQIPFAWDGRNDAGNPVPAGIYQVSATALVGGEPVAVEALTNARVDSVTLGRSGEGITLNLAGLGSLALSEVRQIK